MLPDEQVPMLDANGTPQYVPSTDVELALSQGWTVETPEETNQRHYARDADVGDVAGAAALGAASGASFGLTDLAGSELVPGFRELRQKQREGLPLLSTGSEIAGAIVPALLSGGTGVAGRIASRTPAGALSKALGSSSKLALTGAVEGAAIGAGDVVSEAAITDNYEDLGQKLLISGGLGFVTGGAAGATISGLSKLGKGTLAALRSAKAPVELEQRLGKEAIMEDLGFSGKTLRKVGVDEVKKARVAQGLEDIAARKVAGQSFEEQARFARAAKAEAGPRVGRVVTQLDEAGGLSTEESLGILARAERVVDDLKAKGQAEHLRAAKALEKGLKAADFDSFAGLKKAQEYFSTVGSTGNATANSVQKVKAQAFRDVGNELRAVFNESIESKLGGEALQAFRRASREYEAASLLEQNALSKLGTKPKVPNAPKSFKDQAVDFVRNHVLESAGAAAGTAAFGALGGVGGAVGGYLARRLAGRGLSTLGEVAARKGFAEQVISKAAQGFVKNLPKAGYESVAVAPTAKLLGGNEKEDPNEAASRLRKNVTALLQKDPSERHADLIAQAPETAKAVIAAEEKALDFVLNALGGPDVASPLKPYETVLGPEELRVAGIYTETALNPRSALNDFENGELSFEQAEVLQQVYPMLWAEMQSEVLAELETSKELSYHQRISMGLLFGIESEPSLAPEAIALTQALYLARKAEESATAAGGGNAQDITNQIGSQSERLESALTEPV